jgi:biotin/methionine sulfoxide reductase
VEWDVALDLVAAELDRVRTENGSQAIFGGSYGWASAGRFHHAQSQLRRFLNLAGGHVASRNTYSFAAAEVLFPHVVGLGMREMEDTTTSWPLVTKHCELLVAFGGISGRTAQITSSGTSAHEVEYWLDRLKARIVNVSPQSSDLPQAEHLSIRPGTDTALILALCHTLVSEGRHDQIFLDRYTSGWQTFRAYLEGADGTPKTADWAAPICDVAADRIRDLARDMATRRTMISMTWSLQRADHGEQPIWAGLALGALLGQIGQPGTGYTFGYGSTTPLGRPAKIYKWPSVPQGINAVSNFIPVARIADMLLSPGEIYAYNGEERRYPDIRMIYWVGGNPFHHHQDLNRLSEAWTRPETITVHDHGWTATARRADIVLPATTPLEREDIMMNRQDPTLIYMSKLFDPMGSARNDYDIFREIAGRLGFEDDFTEKRDTEGWLRHLWSRAQAIGNSAGAVLPHFDDFRQTGRFEMPDSFDTRIQFGDFVRDPETHPLATESGRITLTNKTITAMGYEDCPGHPTWLPPVESLLDAAPGALNLISPQPVTRLHSQNDRGSESRDSKLAGREPCYLHPETAASRGIGEGDVVKIVNARGACLAGARLVGTIRKDCVALATGAWFDPAEINGERLERAGNPNVLTNDKGCSKLSQGNIAHTALVFVERWQESLPALGVAAPPTILEN